jgi:penicillin-binding protein 1A
MQKYLEEKFVDSATWPAINNTEYPEGAFVILDPNGKILAIAGSNREKTGNRIFDRAQHRRFGTRVPPSSWFPPICRRLR